MRKSMNFIIVCLAMLAAGCARHSSALPPGPLCVAGIEKTQAMQLAEKTLSRMHFDIRKSDPELGLITTRPLRGGQFFEFWRKDNAGTLNYAESNLHTLRRAVELKISPRQEQSGVGSECPTTVERLSLSERPVTSAARAYEMFSASRPTLQKIEFSEPREYDTTGPRHVAWVHMGPDEQLSKRILQRLKEEIEHSR